MLAIQAQCIIIFSNSWGIKKLIITIIIIITTWPHSSKVLQVTAYLAHVANKWNGILPLLQYAHWMVNTPASTAHDNISSFMTQETIPVMPVLILKQQNKRTGMYSYKIQNSGIIKTEGCCSPSLGLRALP